MIKLLQISNINNQVLTSKTSENILKHIEVLVLAYTILLK